MKKLERFDRYTDEKFAKLLDKSKSKYAEYNTPEQRERLFGPNFRRSKSPAPPAGSSSGNPYAAPTAGQSSNPYAVSTTPQNGNPYAAPAVKDPYTQTQNPYNDTSGYGGLSAQPSQSSQRSASPQPPSYQGGYGGSYGSNDRYGGGQSSGYGSSNPYGGGAASYSSDPYRNEKSPVPSGGYGSSRYNNSGSYGNSSGYGSDPWGSSSGYGAEPPQRQRGYGDFASEAPDEADRNALFGGARQRQQPKAQSEETPAKSSTSYGGSSRYGGYGGGGSSASAPDMDPDRAALFAGARDRGPRKDASSGLPPDQSGNGYDMTDGYMAGSGGYGNHQDRQLTAEEQEEEDVNATKDEIRRIKQQDVASTRNALRIAEQAEQTGRETLERLGLQGEMIHNTEKNLDLASNQNRLAEDKAKELKHLNRSMFAVKMNNPFTKTRRQMEMDDEVMSRHHNEKEQREATRRAAYESQMRRTDASKELRGPSGMVVKKGNLAERSKYQFEADSEDEAMEDEIDSNLDALSRGVGTLNVLGKAMGKEVDSQNKRLDVLAGKTDRVDDEIHMNRARLDRIK